MFFCSGLGMGVSPSLGVGGGHPMGLSLGAGGMHNGVQDLSLPKREHSNRSGEEEEDPQRIPNVSSPFGLSRVKSESGQLKSRSLEISRARISKPYKKLTIILLVVHLLNKIIVNFL